MKVLVVEAEDAVLKVTGVMLNKLGYEVGLALNCNEAYRIYCDNVCRRCCHRSEIPPQFTRRGCQIY